MIIVTANYADSGELISITDSATGAGLTQTFTYHPTSRIVTGVTYSGARSGDITATTTPIDYIAANTTATEYYGYNVTNNINSYTDITGKLHTYDYDGAGRLVREDNEVLGFTKTYTYNGGNIYTVNEYPYTPAGTYPSALLTTYTYNYHNGTDRLLSITNLPEYGTTPTYDFSATLYSTVVICYNGYEADS